MYGQIKRILALVMALSVLLSVCGMTVSAQATGGTLTLDQTTVVNTNENYVYLAFTPAEAGVYVFSSVATIDTYGALFDAQMSELTNDDDNGEAQNFSIFYALEAGQTYYLGVRACSYAVGVEIPVYVEKSPITRVEFNVEEIIENSQGYVYVNGENKYWYYHWYSSVAYTVYFSDGSSQNVVGTSFSYNGTSYFLNWQDSQYDQPWSTGNTYYPTVSVGGHEASVAVSIVESPVASVAVNPVSIMEGTRCYTTHGNDAAGNEVSYTEYHWYTQVVADVTLKNGETIHVAGNNFTYNGKQYNLNYEIGQSAAAPWSKDNTYTVTFSVLGYPCQTTVTIESSPVTRVEVNPLVLTENMGGYWYNGFNYNTNQNEDFYRYNWINSMTYTVYFKDGTSQLVTGGGFNYNGQYHGISYFDPQSAATPWLVDNTYQVEFSIMGVTATLPVTIEPTFIADITLDPIMLAENTGGYPSGYWDENDQYKEYYRYYWWRQMSGTISFRDGSTKRFSGTGFEYEGVYYYFSYQDTQSENHWEVGNTYTCTVSCVGKTAQVEVTVAQNCSSGDFSYIQNGNNAIITGYSGSEKQVTIPQTLEGKTVMGILRLGDGAYRIEELIISDTVTMLAYEAFDGAEKVKKLHLGAGIADFGSEFVHAMSKLETFTVSESNPYLTAVDGVVYDKAVTTLKAYPRNKQDTHEIPDSVTDISCVLAEESNIWGASVQTGAGTPEFVTVDGVVYNKDMTVLYSCAKEKTTYVMPDSVTYISRLALANTNLENVTISPKVTEITYGTFMRSKVKNITIPASVKYIGGEVFAECEQEMTLNVASVEAWCAVIVNDVPDKWNLAVQGTKVTDLTIPNVVKTVYGSSFRNAKLKSLTIPANVKHIDAGAFANTTLETVNFSEGLESLGYGVFSNSMVKEICLPNSLAYMEEGRQFKDCAQLEKVTFGTGLSYIGYDAFAGTAVKSLLLPENIDYIAEEAFANCSNLRSLTVRSRELYVGYRAFQGCPIEKIDLGSGNISIEERAFSGNKAISLVLPESVTEISYRSFDYSTNLVGVVIPQSVTYIDPMAFYGSTNIGHVYYGGTQAQWDAIDGGCHELNNGKLHTQSNSDDFIVNYTCTRMEHYCRICGTWDYVEYDEPRHNMQNGVCTICNDGQNQDGWVEENGKWTYYKHGSKVVDGWISDNGWYYMDANGYMATNRWVKDSTGWCYLGDDGKMVFERWVKDSSGWCYVDKSGYMVYNQWIKDSKGWCYVGKSGYMVYNQWVKDSTGWCYVDKSGYMVFNQWVKDSTGWCYVDKSGYMVYNQWVKDSTGWCYVDKSGYMVYNQWVKDSTGWCYVDKSGYMVYNQWVKDSTGWCYVDKSGYMVYNQWVKDSTGWCYVDKSGYMAYNLWILDGRSWYYVDASGYMLENTSRRIGNKNYYFNASGVCTNP